MVWYLSTYSIVCTCMSSISQLAMGFNSKFYFFNVYLGLEFAPWTLETKHKCSTTRLAVLVTKYNNSIVTGFVIKLKLRRSMEESGEDISWPCNYNEGQSHLVWFFYTSSSGTLKLHACVENNKQLLNREWRWASRRSFTK